METSVNDLKFQAGDRVCYSKSHWDWMKGAGLTRRGPASLRTAFTGTIVSAKRSCVTVDWETGWAMPIARAYKGFPLPSMPTSHLIENLVRV